jgi:hypothetical protein
MARFDGLATNAMAEMAAGPSADTMFPPGVVQRGMGAGPVQLGMQPGGMQGVMQPEGGMQLLGDVVMGTQYPAQGLAQGLAPSMHRTASTNRTQLNNAWGVLENWQLAASEFTPCTPQDFSIDHHALTVIGAICASAAQASGLVPLAPAGPAPPIVPAVAVAVAVNVVANVLFHNAVQHKMVVVSADAACARLALLAYGCNPHNQCSPTTRPPRTHTHRG